MMLRLLAAVIVSLTCFPPSVWAQQGAELTRRSPWGLLAQALLSLAVVVAVIYLVYFGVRRFTAGRLDAGAEGPMRVVQARHLGGDRWVYLIEVEDRRIIVGGGAGQVGPIAELGPRPDDAAGGERRDEA